MTQPISQLLPESPDPNIPQKQAATPNHDVWVAASAGSGKTKVLTDRVLRLLLPDPHGRWKGAAPHKILCITFTKAAAALMALRVQKKLGDWAVMDDAALFKDLKDLLDTDPPPELLDDARALFSRVLDTPGGLSIMTIHAFCQSTLGRFAIEAGVTPGFTVLEDPRARDILRRIMDGVIHSIEAGSLPDLAPSFHRLATYLDLESLRDTVLHLASHSRNIHTFCESCGDSSRPRAEQIQTRVLTDLGYDPTATLGMAESDLRYMAKLLSEKGGMRDKECGQRIADWLALPADAQIAQLDLLQDAFLTKADKTLRAPVKAITANHPEFFIMRDAALQTLMTYQDHQAKYRQSQQTADLVAIVAHCLAQYARTKKELNALDFNDLILKTQTLLESERLDWVHYKLDEGIDHILVDEAQDTNGHQWDIIRHLSDDFLSGDSDTQRLRSLFVVGDEKQSIFSFHGADPDAFQTMRDMFATRSRDAGRVFDPVRLETSFRSTRPVLDLVDTVFERPDLSVRLGLPPTHKLVHYSYRPTEAGLVELWEPILREKPNTRNQDIAWVLPPLSSSPSTSPQISPQISPSPSPQAFSSASPLASKIAATIADWLDKGEILESAGRPVEPRDILVLVRTRTRFVPDLVRQLKKRGVPVSGVDRMKLTDQIAISDCLALARFARFPDDDLSLACLLRSPLIRLPESDLMTVALGRTGSLWDRVRDHLPEATTAWLQQAIDRSRTEKPFDFYDDMLNSICPFDGVSSGWKAFATCLGADCLDPLDEFLSFCLNKEADGIFSLEELISVLESSAIEIKRDTEDGDKDALNQVRIMTVHASKGLEAPIVFLPDTMGVPSKGKIDTLQWLSRTHDHITDDQITDGNTTSPPTPLWAARSSDGCATYQALKEADYDRMISEHMRLLYVALTRPKDRLYVMGETSSLNFSDYAWYKLVYDAFQKLPHTAVDGVLRYTSPQTEPPRSADGSGGALTAKTALPDWVFRAAPEDALPGIRIIQPSRLARDSDDHDGAGTAPDIRIHDRARSPLDDASAYRFQRGNLTHKLFQILPDLPLATRESAAHRFLTRMGHMLPEDIRQDIVRETMAILNDPVFAAVFGENSLAEVPVSGDLGDGRMISGQIDRLVIGHNQILIVDFKTNRPSPRDAADIPEAYRNQLRAYKTAILRIFPDRPVACALLWTDQPVLMPIDVPVDL